MTTFRANWPVFVFAFLVASFMVRFASGEDVKTSLQKSAIGVTRQDRPIECLIHDEDLDFGTTKLRLLLIGGLDGSAASVQATKDALRWFYDSADAKSFRPNFIVSAVPCANPDALARKLDPDSQAGGNPTRGYPPTGAAYGSQTDPEAAYLWRWTGMHAPDLVVVVRAGDRIEWVFPDSPFGSLTRLSAKLRPHGKSLHDDGLCEQLVQAAPCETGKIPAIELRVSTQSNDATDTLMPQLLAALDESKFDHPSPARRELQNRLDRSPLEVATQLSRHYGDDLDQVVYIPALALIGRVRLGDLLDAPDQLRDVERIVAPYFDGQRSSAPNSGSGLSGHLIFCELASRATRERRERYVELARLAADLAFDEDGKSKASMPFHSEMSDAVFMGGPILASVGSLTGDQRYFDACAKHTAFMQQLVLRDDGLYRHSPLDEAAWGRGNGFPALGLAMVLSDFPPEHAERQRLLAAFQAHIAALANHQDATGCWHQVIDRPESYREQTATCMITFAMIRGVREGWLDGKQYAPVIERAWYAIRTRAPPNGRLVDVCTGTGKQKDLRAYYDRTAILGPDARGGAMALLVSTEMAAWKAEAEQRPDN